MGINWTEWGQIVLLPLCRIAFLLKMEHIFHPAVILSQQHPMHISNQIPGGKRLLIHIPGCTVDLSLLHSFFLLTLDTAIHIPSYAFVYHLLYVY